MITPEFESTDVPNVVDRAAASADHAVQATKRATVAAFDNVSDRIEGMRDRASPVVDRVTAPFDEVSRYTKAQPLTSLLMAAAAGAGLMVLLSLVTRSR
jgi:ElaB/YqjD/DUF883 family membrane-anchored ribosome-binding protein